MLRIQELSVTMLFLAMLSGLLMTGCGELSPTPESPPPLAEGLTGDWKQVTKAFDRRIKTKFPKGSEVSVLKTELAQEGFEFRPCNGPVGEADLEFTACREVHKPSCTDVWIVSWSATDNKITATESMLWGWCIS